LYDGCLLVQPGLLNALPDRITVLLLLFQELLQLQGGISWISRAAGGNAHACSCRLLLLLVVVLLVLQSCC
jgi:hypothetical protein